jgi:hypothetical protein
MPGDIRDKLVRSRHWAEALREAGVLLAIFGPVSIAEIFKSISLTTAIAIWLASGLGLFVGIEWSVNLERKKRRLAARGLCERVYPHSSRGAAHADVCNCGLVVYARNRPFSGGEPWPDKT